MIDRVPSHAIEQAKREAYGISRTGPDLEFIRENSRLTVKTFSTEYSPFDRKITGKVSWAYEVDIITYLAKKELDDRGITKQELLRFTKIRLNRLEYTLKYVEYYGNMGDDYIFYIVGAVK